MLTIVFPTPKMRFDHTNPIEIFISFEINRITQINSRDLLACLLEDLKVIALTTPDVEYGLELVVFQEFCEGGFSEHSLSFPFPPASGTKAFAGTFIEKLVAIAILGVSPW
jgi:hypothetical protein